MFISNNEPKKNNNNNEPTHRCSFLPCIRFLISDYLQCSTLKSCSNNRVSLRTGQSLPHTTFLQLGVSSAVSVDRVFRCQVPQVETSLHCACHKALIHVQREIGNASWELRAPETTLGLPEVEHPDIAIGKSSNDDLSIVTARDRPTVVLLSLALLSLNARHTSNQLSLVPNSYLYQLY